MDTVTRWNGAARSWWQFMHSRTAETFADISCASMPVRSSMWPEESYFIMVKD